ncbi:mechanosensitive ion channel family protein [Pedobacter puniceum]|jgi:small-conductance mechanosensitive channel|uniref:Mechanosensitive ion channel n=1 Tax=Pedobacter puniceum TaxID=2666136 RepID=A0A7K0FKM3_9SPHI|nr:mechanosensitive ion channel domain-containing protein [Pedobacter puniceum]MRX46342.1 mechanosensitive ion channel [Pedobacter puniceum]
MNIKDITAKERSTTTELLVIFIKLVVYATLVYFNINQPEIYAKVPIIGKVAYSLLIVTGASFSISVVRLIIIYWYIRKNNLKANIKDNFILGINRIVSVLNTVFLIIAIMVFMGIDPIKFLTSITIVAAAIALIFKEYVTNMINGLIIMFSDRLSLGDHIKVLDQEGKILDITLINIIIQNEDNDMVLIPNSVIFTSLIVNQSKQNIKKLTVEFELDVNLNQTPASLEAHLENIIKPYEDYTMKDGFSVKTLEIRKDYTKFKVQVLLNYHDRAKEKEIRRKLNTAVLELRGGV